ncbi:hypothetical protein N9Y92_00795 [Chlamydiales bacterium]|nr:hypothetical protein [Chlamydiales bacterium]
MTIIPKDIEAYFIEVSQNTFQNNIIDRNRLSLGDQHLDLETLEKCTQAKTVHISLFKTFIEQLDLQSSVEIETKVKKWNPFFGDSVSVTVVTYALSLKFFEKLEPLDPKLSKIRCETIEFMVRNAHALFEREEEYFTCGSLSGDSSSSLLLK